MKIIIAGGGTGGHLYPGIAIAREFQKRSSDTEILFVGTRRGIEYRVLPKENLQLKTISSSGLKGRFSWRTVVALCQAPVAIFQSLWILINFRPNLVLGVGGYVTGPFVLTAWLLKIPTAIQEQNLMPGMTNRILGKFVDKIFVTFDKSNKYFSTGKVKLTGNPIRKEFYETERKVKKKRLCILIFGGSRGANSINLAMVEALDILSKGKDLFHFIHQTGEEQFEMVLTKYREKNMSADVSPFINKMADAYQEADLVVCRAGASTIAELTACGKASVLIPFPFAANNHQHLNAELLVEKGAAVLIKDAELTGKKVAEFIQELLEQPDRIANMEKASAGLGNKEAGIKIVDLCNELIKEKN